MAWNARNASPHIRVHRGAKAAAYFGASVALLIGGAACGGGGNDLCDPPKLPDYGTSADGSGNTTVNLELGKTMIRERVQQALESSTELSDGARITDARLEQQGSGDEELNFLAVHLKPWKKVLGRIVSLPRTYILRVRIVPYVIDQTTIADAARRRQILGTRPGGAGDGAVARFEFYDLRRTGDEKVECSKFDRLDKIVLKGVRAGFVFTDGRITTNLSSGAVDGNNTTFRARMKPLAESDATQWDIYRADGMAFVGRVRDVSDNVTLELDRPAAIALDNEKYLAVRRPLVLPIEFITNLIAGPTGRPSVKAINVGTQGDLKLGFAIGGVIVGPPPPPGVRHRAPPPRQFIGLATLPFSPESDIERTDDWKIETSTLYLRSAIGVQLRRILKENNVPFDLTDVVIAFGPGNSPSLLYALVGNFGVTWVISGSVTPSVRAGNDGKPYLMAHRNRGPDIVPPLLQWLLSAATNAVYTQPGGCADALGPALELEAFDDDVLYPTAVRLDPGRRSVSLAGRSRFIDERLAATGLDPRPELEHC